MVNKLLEKKILLVPAVALLVFVTIFLAIPKAQAKPILVSSVNNFAVTCSKPLFFGLVPWYQYLPVAQDQNANTDSSGQSDNCQIGFNLAGKGGEFSGSGSGSSCSGTTASGTKYNNCHALDEVWLIGLAVFEDLLRVSGLVAVAFVIYGGARLMASQGNPEATKGAQATITNALIGLAIAVLAATTVSFIASKLGG